MSKFKDKVVYQIYPKSFQDSNGDGLGDLRGVIQRLDYLQSLGVDYLWLTPFFPSPQHDNGYDVADYCAVDPRFGTMADFDELVKIAGEKGMKIMLDMVLCHTSADHEWFQKAINGDEHYQRYYILRDGRGPGEPPTNWQCAFGGSAWEWQPQIGKWYLHLHDVSQPDLDWTNPEVRKELANVVKFWRDKGVMGFRFDVINLISKPEIFEDDTTGLGRRLFADGPHVHEYLQELVKNAGIDGMITVGEMASTDLANCIRYSNPDNHELSMSFSFHHLKVDYKNGDKWALMPPDIKALKTIFEEWQVGMQNGNGWNAVFYNNHDQPRIVSRFGDDQNYLKESAKMLAASIHLMRGTPYIYQGEELGMTNAKYTSIEQYRDVESLNYYKILLEQGKSKDEALKIIGERSRDNSRTPMQWSAEKFAGFSTVESWISSPDNYKSINVEAEKNDDNSVLNFYKLLVKFRKENKIVQEGDIKFIERENDNVLAYVRSLGNNELIVICNFRGKDISLTEKTLSDYTKNGYKKTLGNYDGLVENLRPYEVVVFQR
ncbi:MAG: alpha,alpha-phosphotrehalase [Selenomonadaceae bacterium]|nr:alpha,alpha-phosphotrehalase [Selenomonadaceae bacterium]MBR1857874.1 alpha,alpha-phosphotrehalase [Selenomonadaceae bacterium]